MPESPRFIKLLEEMRDIHKRKNAGYAGKDTEDPWANFRMAEAIGVSPFKGCLVRISDKFIRVCNLAKDANNEQVGESITDTLIDLANYALIAICLYEEVPYDGHDDIPNSNFTTLKAEALQEALDESAENTFEKYNDIAATVQRILKSGYTIEQFEAALKTQIKLTGIDIVGFESENEPKKETNDSPEYVLKAMQDYEKKHTHDHGPINLDPPNHELWSSMDGYAAVSRRTYGIDEKEGYWINVRQKNKFLTKAEMYSLIVAIADDLNCKIVSKRKPCNHE